MRTSQNQEGPLPSPLGNILHWTYAGFTRNLHFGVERYLPSSSCKTRPRLPPALACDLFQYPTAIVFDRFLCQGHQIDVSPAFNRLGKRIPNVFGGQLMVSLFVSEPYGLFFLASMINEVYAWRFFQLRGSYRVDLLIIPSERSQSVK